MAVQKFNLRRRENHNFGLTGISVFVILFAATYMFGALRTSGLSDKSYNSLISKRHKKINDDFAYEFLNALRDQNFDSSFNLKWQSLKTSDQMKNFISSINSNILSDDIKRELLRKSFEEIGIWDDNQLIRIKCLTDREIEKGFENGDFITAWENFRLKYGGGYHEFSIPISDKKKEVVVIRHHYRCGSLCAEEEFILFKKINGRWIEIDKKILWMS